MQFYSGRLIRGETALGLSFIDIDNDAYEAWGESLITDRSRLLRLIDYAVKGGATTVVVDIELTRSGDGDEALLDYLSTYSDATPLIFLRTLEAPVSDRVVRIPRPSILDGAVANSAPVYFASTSFIRDGDHVVRGWRLWEPVCNNGVPA